MKKSLSLILAALMILCALTACGEKKSADGMETGTITLELYPDKAPITVQNFIDLANSKFYDGLTFHRIYSGFMIQGGDPNGDGTGGSKNTIKGEFSSNGVDNDLSHTRGVISMARSNNPDSASSQFFICHQDSQFLDGNYAAFGKVTDGMDVVDAIAAVDVTYNAAEGANTKPVTPPVIKSVEIDESGSVPTAKITVEYKPGTAAK